MKFEHRPPLKGYPMVPRPVGEVCECGDPSEWHSSDRNGYGGICYSLVYKDNVYKSLCGCEKFRDEFSECIKKLRRENK